MSSPRRTLFRNWNYAASGSEEYDRWLGQIDQFIATKGRKHEEVF
jgi:hypothetical protein